MSSITKKYSNWIYYLTIGYNVKDLNLRFVAYNPFSSRLSSITTIDTEYYSQTRRNYTRFNANVFSVQLTYTLSYGKKVSRSVSAPSEILDSGGMNPD